jgi:hypothetical protein
MTLYNWMVWLHIFSALVYFSCHGVAMAAAYLTMAALVNLWRRGWWLTSTLIFLLMTFWMVWYARKYYSPIRKALGLEYMEGFTHRPAETPNKVDLSEVQKLIAITNPHLLMTVGVIAIGVLLWLMRFKPF